MNGIRRSTAAEAYGTFLLVMVGPGTITATRLADFGSSSAAALGVIGFAHGVALLVVIYSIGHISGAHINPAVTLAAWATRRIEARRVAPYIIAQLVGASIAGLVQLVLWSSSSAPDYGVAKSTFLGDTTPGSGFTIGAALLAEIVGTAILVFTIFGATDKKSDQSWAGAAIGLVLAAVIWMFGPISGASLNPARTWGPTLASAAFSLTPFGTLWIYIIGPIFGGLLGGFLYETVK